MASIFLNMKHLMQIKLKGRNQIDTRINFKDTIPPVIINSKELIDTKIVISKEN